MYSYESRIRSLEEVVGLLLARQGPGPFRLVPLAPLVGSFRYSTSHGLTPVLSKSATESLALARSNQSSDDRTDFRPLATSRPRPRSSPPLACTPTLRPQRQPSSAPSRTSHASKDVVVGSRDPLLVPPLNTARRTPSNSQIDIGDDRNHHPIQDSPSHSPATLSLSSDLAQQWANTLT
ncbi:hypothetical protein PSTG_18439, partial [Puccinia striiformis f. sp. tritici PST-78]